MNAKIIMKQKKRNQLAAQIKSLRSRRSQLLTEERALQKRAETEDITEELEQEVEANAQELQQVETDLVELQEQVEAIDEELKALEEEPVEEPVEDPAPARSRSARRAAPAESGSFRCRSQCFETRSARDAFYQHNEVKTFLGRIRELGGSSRSVKGSELTIPTVMLELLRDNVNKSSKLITKVRLRSVSGAARQNVLGKVPEGIWMEMCGKLNELEFAFSQLEVDGYKVGGFIPICNAMLADSDVNLGEEIMGMLLASIGYALDKAIVYGQGKTAKMPLGVVSRLAQTDAPEDWGEDRGAWTDLHSSHVLSLNLASQDGEAFYRPLMAALGKAEPDYASGGTCWVMNRLTHLDLMARGLSFNAAGTLVSGINGAMPVENGEIIELDFIPDYEFVGGYFDLYLLAEREGGSVAQSEHVRFLEDQTVFKGTARYDGQPILGEGFVAVNYNNQAVTTSVSFKPDLAQKLNALIVTAAGGTKGTVLTVAGGIGSSGYTYAYIAGVPTADIRAGAAAPKGFKPLVSGTTDIEVAAGTPITVIELAEDGRVASCGTVAAVLTAAPG